MFFYWLVIACMFLILEIGSPGLFYFLSFCFGAILGAISSLYVESITLQSIIFLLGTVAALAILKFCIRSWRRTAKTPLTNVYALKGKHGKVISDIGPNKPGQVKVVGQEWSANSVNDVAIAAGATVEIISVSGTFLLVKEINQP